MYRPFGPMAEFELGNGLALTLGYDQDGRLSSLRAADADTTVQDLAYGYDLASNVTAITDNQTPARSQSFAYDPLYRLTGATGAYGSLAYGYDAVGNRVSQTVDGVASSFAYSGGSNLLLSITQGALARDFTYAADGSLLEDRRPGGSTFAFAYDPAGRLSGVSVNGVPAAGYEVDARGLRVVKDRPGVGTTHYLYDAEGRLLAEAGPSGATTREYVWLEGLPLALVADVATSPSLRYVHADHLGQPQKLTDANQAVVWDAVFRPFGEAHAITGAAANDLRFPGQLYDGETGFHYNGQRDYDPSVGRYIESDPIGLAGGINTYAYVGGNPLRWIDLDGLAPDSARGPIEPFVFDPKNPPKPPVGIPETRQPDLPPRVQRTDFCVADFLRCISKTKTARICKLPGSFGKAAQAGVAVGCFVRFGLCMTLRYGDFDMF